MKERLTAKYNTFKLLLQNKKVKTFLIIDIVFYTYCFLGFIVAALIGSSYNLPLSTVAFTWVIIFLPILVAKMYKEIYKNKNKNEEFYTKDSNNDKDG